MLARPVCAVSRIATELAFSKVLSVGPRAEGELLALAGYGFSWQNIHGLDLFSYSPRIDVGDMHEMPYEDDTFDAIFCGWTLGYSDDRPQALREMVRVTRPGGLIAIGEAFHSRDFDEGTEAHGYELGSKERINQLDEIVEPIKDSIDEWYFRQKRHRRRPDQGDHRHRRRVFRAQAGGGNRRMTDTDARAAFDAKGYHVIPGLLSGDEAAAYRLEINKVFDLPARELSNADIDSKNLHDARRRHKDTGILAAGL